VVTEDIRALLDDADEQIRLATTLHARALAIPTARGPFKTRVKNVLEAQRSALDYLAVRITERYGTPSKKFIYYPLAQSEPEFPSEMGSKMPGVAAAEPGIAEAIKQFQPFQINGEWLRDLNQLTREQKHNRLSIQLVKQTYQCEVTEKATGAMVSWYGVRFEPGMIHSEGGIISLSNLHERPADAPKPFEVGVGPTGFLVFGVPLDPQTQLPYPTAELRAQRGPLDRWCFVSPHKPTMLLLTDVQGWLRRAVDAISQAARL
jgi:hypothetical protein